MFQIRTTSVLKRASRNEQFFNFSTFRSEYVQSQINKNVLVCDLIKLNVPEECSHGYDLEIYKMTFGTSVKAHAFVYRVKYIYLRVSITKLWSRKKINLCILIFIDQYFGRGYDTPIGYVLCCFLFYFYFFCTWRTLCNDPGYVHGMSNFIWILITKIYSSSIYTIQMQFGILNSEM